MAGDRLHGIVYREGDGDKDCLEFLIVFINIRRGNVDIRGGEKRIDFNKLDFQIRGDWNEHDVIVDAGLDALGIQCRSNIFEKAHGGLKSILRKQRFPR